ncbi:restriction endonuclease subunit S [Virgibacillus dakarensis]|nr:restriction endonuclease subunit S [Virgibacillus dakarensis]
MEQREFVPKKRFRGFNEYWKEVRLEEALEVNSGRDYKHLQKGNIPVYGTGGYMFSVNDSLSTVDGIGIGRKGTIDKPQYLKAPFWTVDTLFYMIPKDSNDIYFMYTKGKSINWRLLDASTGVPSLSKVDINNVKLVIPKKKEQQKIGAFFKVLDERIANQKRKIAKVKALKAAYLTEMFPQEGETAPKRRFKGFEGEWVVRELSDIVYKAVDNRGKTPPLNKKGIHPIIEVMSLGNRKPYYTNVEKYIDEFTYNNFLRDYVKENDILFSTVGRIGVVSMMDSNQYATIAQNIVGFRAKENYSPNFLYALFSNKLNFKRVNKIVMGAVQPSVKVSELIKVNYLVSSNIKEQQKIGNFFKNLDEQIETEEKKLDKLQKMKEAYLEEMFV